MTEAKADQAAQTPAEEPAGTVWEAWRRVMRDLPGIAKLSPAEHKQAAGGAPPRSGDDGGGISYSYRSIEQVTAETQRLFARHGVTLVPQVVASPEPRAFTMGTKATRWEDVKVLVLYWVVGPGGATYRQQTGPDGQLAWWYDGDCFCAGPFTGVGRDNSDKGYNKAMTQAEKQCLLQLLQIGDPREDGEHERPLDEGSHAAGTGQGGEGQPEWWQVRGYPSLDEADETSRRLVAKSREVPTELRQPIRDWLAEHNEGRQPPINADQVSEYEGLIDLALQLAEADKADTGPAQAPQAPQEPPASAEPQRSAGPPTAAEAATQPPEQPPQGEQASGGATDPGEGRPAGASGRRPRNPR